MERGYAPPPELKLVGKVGLEPTRPKALVPKTSVSTIPPLPHLQNTLLVWFIFPLNQQQRLESYLDLQAARPASHLNRHSI